MQHIKNAKYQLTSWPS